MPVALLYLGILVAAFLLLIVRPQRRQMAAHRALVASLQVGEEVVTSGGIYGTIRGLDDGTVDLEVSSGIVLRVVPFVPRRLGTNLHGLVFLISQVDA